MPLQLLPGVLGIGLKKSSERLGKDVNRFRVCEDVFDDPRNIMNELKKFELILEVFCEDAYFVVALMLIIYHLLNID